MNVLNALRSFFPRSTARRRLREASPTLTPHQPADLPPFTLQVADQMRFDPQVRIGLGARNGLLMSAQVDVIGRDAALNRWVKRQWRRLWSTSAHQLLRTKLYGFMPFEVEFRQAVGGEYDGALEFDRLKDHEPRKCRLLFADDRLAGFIMRDRGQETTILAPQALVTTFDAERSNPYGCALLARAFPAWYEKWMEGGAKRTLRLRMVKDAYVGETTWYIYPLRKQAPTANFGNSGGGLLYLELFRRLLRQRKSSDIPNQLPVGARPRSFAGTGRIPTGFFYCHGGLHGPATCKTTEREKLRHYCV